MTCQAEPVIQPSCVQHLSLLFFSSSSFFLQRGRFFRVQVATFFNPVEKCKKKKKKNPHRCQSGVCAAPGAGARARLLGCLGTDLTVVKRNGVQITAKGGSNENSSRLGP